MDWTHLLGVSGEGGQEYEDYDARSGDGWDALAAHRESSSVDVILRSPSGAGVWGYGQDGAKLSTGRAGSSIPKEYPSHTGLHWFWCRHLCRWREIGPLARRIAEGGCPYMSFSTRAEVIQRGKTILGWNRLPAMRVAMARRVVCPEKTLTWRARETSGRLMGRPLRMRAAVGSSAVTEGNCGKSWRG